MELLKEYKKSYEGYECIVYDYIYLIKLDTNLYNVIRTEAAKGDWTGNPIITSSKAFTDFSRASDYMETLILRSSGKV
jgi:hypothetical protein